MVFAPIARGAVRIWSVTPVLLVETLLIFVWLWKVNNSKGYVFKHTPIDKPIFLFAMLAVVSLIFSIYKHDSFYALLRILGYIGIYYLVVNEFDHNMRKRLIGFVICMGTGISVYGLLQYFGLLNHSWWYPKDYLAATYVNHNHFAGYLELAIPVTIGTLFKSILNIAKRKTAIRYYEIGLVSSLIIMTAAFISAQSRGAWFSLAISIFLMGLILARREALNKKNLFVFILLFLIIISLASFGKDIISQRMAEGEASPEMRLKIWRGTIRMIMANPFVGTGIGTFIWGFSRFRPEGLEAQANFAHNDYLQFAAEMGILASLAMVWLLLSTIIRGTRENVFHPVKLGCAIGVLSLSLHGIVDFNFHIPSNMLLFVIYLAIVMSRNDKAGD